MVIVRISVTLLLAGLLCGTACSGAPSLPSDACGGCEAGRVCEVQTCVCEVPSLPCTPTCAADDVRCERGVFDEARCRCEPLSQTALLETITLSPSPVVLEIGAQQQIMATGHFSNGSAIDISSTVAFGVTPKSLATVQADGLLQALAAGSGEVVGSVGSVEGRAPLTVTRGLAKELRGLWVTRWNYRSEADVRRIIQVAAAAGLNAIFFQVRGRADAFYRSNLEPWASELSGTLGKDPGWDPLAVALAEAKTQGVELHAWLNTVPVWSGSQAPPETTPRHLLLDHPEWLMVDENGRRQQLGDSGYLCLSPGIPAARAHLLAVMEDLLSNYAVDGLHLDYIRYYGATFSHDPVSTQAFEMARASDPGLSFGDWQRAQVAEIVRGVWSVTRAHPGVSLSAAVWHNNNLAVAGSRGYRDYYQDSHAWIAEGIVDALVPMNYLRLDSNPSFAALADDHLANAAGRHIYMGIHVLGRGSDPDPTGTQMLLNIDYARKGGAQGVVLFAWPYLEDNALWDDLRNGPFAEPAEPPPITW